MPATDNQLRFLKNLISQRVFEGDKHLQWKAMCLSELEGGSLTIERASKWIDWLKGLPAPAKAASTPADLGYYHPIGDLSTVFVVVENKEKTSRYAKRLVIDGNRGKWQYDHRRVYELGYTDRYVKFTVEEAAALGKQHGLCIICGRTLTDPKSVEAGIGDICKSRL